MATTFYLKLRPIGDNLNVSLRQMVAIANLPEEDAKDLLYRQFSGLDETKLEVHDKQWFSQLVNWTPEKGLAMTEMAKWMKIATQVNGWDDEVEGEVTISSANTELIWQRLKNPEYKRIGTSPSFFEFMQDWMEASDTWFDGMEPEVEDEGVVVEAVEELEENES